MALRLSVHRLYVTIRYCTKIAKCRDCSFVVPKIIVKFKWNHSNGVQNAVGLGENRQFLGDRLYNGSSYAIGPLSVCLSLLSVYLTVLSLYRLSWCIVAKQLDGSR